MKIDIFDTTLRDGFQQEGISPSVKDKLEIAKLLDNLGVASVSGTSFGEYGEGYIRLSCANSDSAIEEAISRIKEFFN